MYNSILIDNRKPSNKTNKTDDNDVFIVNKNNLFKNKKKSEKLGNHFSCLPAKIA